jgi:hypothetical protein
MSRIPEGPENSSTAEGRPCVDLRGCRPREVLRRVEQFLDAMCDDVLRTRAAALVLEDRGCADIAVDIARLRVTLFAEKMARLEAVVTMLEDLANERTGGPTT